MTDSPDSGKLQSKTENTPLLEVRNLKKYFPIYKGILHKEVNQVRAVDDVSLYIREGETLGLVGESGCGKTTVSRCILRAIDPTSGEILFREADAADADDFSRPVRFTQPAHDHIRNHQRTVICQRDEIQNRARRPRARAAAAGGTAARVYGALPACLQRRAAPAQALDVSVQAQVLNLMLDLQEKLNLTYLLVAHDLSVVKHISDRVCVMYVGKLVEMADTDELFQSPQHPYTAALMTAVPVPDPSRRDIIQDLPGEVANPANPPSGCYFHPRCRFAAEICRTEPPRLREIAPNHYVSCHRAEELQLAGIKETKMD